MEALLIDSGKPQFQAARCRPPPVWKGIWRDRKGKSWYVEACREHAPKVKVSRRDEESTSSST